MKLSKLAFVGFYSIQMSEDAAENTLKDQQHNAGITRSDISTPVDWMYAQVDKKKKRGRRALLKTTEASLISVCNNVGCDPSDPTQSCQVAAKNFN